MTEEKALMLFARCYNRCDFSDAFKHMHKKISYEAFNRFYRHEGRESVARALNDKAAELRALPRPNRAYRGFLMSKHDFMDLPKCESCIVLTMDDYREVLGIVSIKSSLFGIRSIRILNPVQCQYTRGDFCGREDN